LKIGIDVESGERPFNELVEGVLQSSLMYPAVFFFIIGNTYKIKSCFPKISNINNIILVDSQEVIGMDESPLLAIKRKKNSTVVTGVNLVKNKTIDAFLSPGNTGATVAASLFGLGLFPGLKRPSLGSFFPRMSVGESFILDVGANPEVREDYMYQNGLLGSVFYKILFNVDVPKIGLLSIGTETGKGNSVVKKAYSLLSAVEGFVGNVEPYNLIDGSVDVVVCDGFTGNTIIKTAESLKKLFSFKFKNFIKQSVSDSITKKLMFAPLKKLVTDPKMNSDFTDQFLPKYYGAAPLLGVNGTVFVGHGNMGCKDMLNAIDFMISYQKNNCDVAIAKEWKKEKYFY